MGLFSFLKRDDTATAAPKKSAKSGTKTSAADDVQVLRTRARRRLIGAAVLVAAGVVGFPLIFETQPRPIPVDLPIEIPRKETAPPLVVPTREPLSQAEPAPAHSASAELPVVAKVAERAVEKPAEMPAEKPVARPLEKPADKPADKPKLAEKPVEKQVDKPADKPKAAGDGARAQALRHLLLETPVAPQVEQGRSRRAGQYQRGAGIGRVYRLRRLHAAAGAHGGQPVCAARREALHQHRQGFLPRSAPAGEVQQALAQTAQRQAAMSLALEMREQRAGHQQLGRRFGVALGDELRQRPIELAQQARIGQGAQAAEHRRALIRGARHGAHACASGAAATSLPCSSASSASISARGGASAITPAPGASMPRRKKKSAPPRSRSGA